MDILDLSTSLKYLQHNGVGLNQEEKLQLELGLQQLLIQNEGDSPAFEELLLWGKLNGLNADYYIAMGINYQFKYEFPEKVFYYALSTNYVRNLYSKVLIFLQQFKPFPPLNDQHRDKYNEIKGLLLGNPDKVHIQVEPLKTDEEQENTQEQQPKEVDPLASSESEDEAAKIVKVNLKEIDRVHYIVRAIENDCHVVPHGSYKLNTSHEVQRNEAFRGLTLDEAFKLTSYSHFRNVQQKEKKEGLEKDDAIFSRNFLDDIVADKPIGQWAIQKDSTGRVAILRNLLWPGYFAFHKAGTNSFGSFYLGDGPKNVELPFML